MFKFIKRCFSRFIGAIAASNTISFDRGAIDDPKGDPLEYALAVLWMYDDIWFNYRAHLTTIATYCLLDLSEDDDRLRYDAEYRDLVALITITLILRNYTEVGTNISLAADDMPRDLFTNFEDAYIYQAIALIKHYQFKPFSLPTTEHGEGFKHYLLRVLEDRS